MDPVTIPEPRPQPRLMLRVATILAICIGAFGLYSAQRLTALANVLSEHHATTLAAHIAMLTRVDVAANDGIALAARLEGFNAFTALRSVTVTDRQGLALAAVQRNVAGNLSAMPLREIGMLGNPGSAPRNQGVLLPASEPLVVWAAIGPIAPIGWVRVEYETTASASLFGRAQLEAVAIGLILILLAIVAARIAVRHSRAAPPPSASRATSSPTDPAQPR